ncbi:MAG: TolC family protein [Bacillota bacterium]|nr:TolC family protein [Bacillota bacterium]HHU61391.1 TolC family protein [Natronincola sp.]
MKRNLILFIAILFLINGVAFAKDAAMELSFSHAIDLMEKNNTALQIAQINYKIATIDYEKAKASNLMSASRHSEMQAEHNFAKAKNTYENSKRSAYLELLKNYTNVLSAEQSVQIREHELIVAENNYKIMQEKIRIGDAGRIDDLQEMNKVESARRSLKAAQQKLDEETRDLKRFLGLSENTVVELSFDFSVPELEKTQDESIELGLENSFTLRDLKYNLEQQERQLETAKIEGIPPMDLERSQLSLEIARLNFEKEQSDITDNIIAQHQGLIDSTDRFANIEREWEIAQETYDIYRRQEEIGLITEIQLLQHKVSLLNSEANRKDAIVAHIISYLQFQNTLGLEGSLQ